MTATAFKFSEKSLDLIACPSRIDIAEGTARSSKSTSVMFKLGLKVNMSNYNQFFIAGSTSGVARRNLIDNRNGFKDMFRGHVKEGKDPKRGNHLIFTDDQGREKIIYIFGFRDKARWQMVLGSTTGGGVIDEINTADPNFVKEVFRSLITVGDSWLGATLNPDNPDKEIYSEFINRTRPLKKWRHDIPWEIIDELKQIPTHNIIPGAVYWHFNFNDNPAMTVDKIEFFKTLYPPDSFYYNSKILGIRGVAEGVVFGKYLNDSFFAPTVEAVYDGRKQRMTEIKRRMLFGEYIRYSIGIDLGNNELKWGTVLTFSGILRGFKGVDAIDVYQATSTETNDLVAEICNKIVEWYKMLRNPSLFDGAWIDGYGAIGIMIPTIRKKLQDMGYSQIKVDLAIKFGDEGGRMSRMLLLLLLINQNKVLFNTTKGCVALHKSLRKLVYGPDGLPLDENQSEMDFYDSYCYSFTPYTIKLNDEINSKLIA